MKISAKIRKTKAFIYSENVISGKTVACGWIIKACKRFQYDLTREDLTYNLNEVSKITMWFEEVVYVPELGRCSELPLPHAFWLQQLYGFYYVKTGQRRFKEMLLEVARKNAKTFYAANISLYELIAGRDMFPMIMQGANSRDQALICTRMTGRLIEKSPELNSILSTAALRIFRYGGEAVKVSYKTKEREGKIEAMPSDPGDGGNPSLYVVDELHEATNMALIETMKSGQGARRDPLGIIISSPGYNKQGPLFAVFRAEAIKVLDGVLQNDRLLAIIFEQDKEEDWDKPECYEKANPMLPYLKNLASFLDDRIKDAKNKGGSVQVSVKIKNCGVWVDSAATWVDSEVIRQNEHGVAYEELEGKDCYLGIDLSSAKDLTAVGYLFPNIRPGVHAYYVQCHIPEEKLKNNEDFIDYQLWVDEGWLIVHEGNVIDHDIVSQKALEYMKSVNVKGIGFDVRHAYGGVITTIAKNGYEALCSPTSQGFKLSPAVITTEAGLEKKKYNFFNNPVTAWNFSNVVMKIGEQGDYFPDKSKGANKIDIISALLTAETERNHREQGKTKVDVGIRILN